MSEKRKSHKADICLVAALLLVAGILYFVFSGQKEEGAWAVVTVDGREAGRYSLEENGTYPLNGGTNVLIIQDGVAWLNYADCPDKLCVNQGKIRYGGQCIVCLPNKLTVTLEGAESGVDLVS